MRQNKMELTVTRVTGIETETGIAKKLDAKGEIVFFDGEKVRGRLDITIVIKGDDEEFDPCLNDIDVGMRLQATLARIHAALDSFEILDKKLE